MNDSVNGKRSRVHIFLCSWLIVVVLDIRLAAECQRNGSFSFSFHSSIVLIIVRCPDRRVLEGR